MDKPSRGAGGYAWLTDHFAFALLRIVHFLIPAVNLVLQRRSGARLVHLAVQGIIESRGCHLGRLGVMLLTSLAMAAFSGVEVPPDGCL